MKLADNEILPAVLRKIELLNTRCANALDALRLAPTLDSHEWISDFYNRNKRAENRLRDFATVELLCEGLGTTREEALS